MKEIFVKYCEENRVKTPKEFQLDCAYKNYVTPRFFNFSVPGSGKTFMSIMTFDYLKFENKVQKLLVIGPKNGLDAWNAEIVEELKIKVDLNILNSEINFLNYEKLSNKSYFDFISNFIDEDTFVVIDEFHRIKNPNAKRTRLIKELLNEAQYITMLSGSPLPNGLIDLKEPTSIITDTINLSLFNDNSNLHIVKEYLDEFSFCATKKDLKLPKINNIFHHYELQPIERDVLKIIWSTQMNFMHKFVMTQQYLSGVNNIIDDIDFQKKMRQSKIDELRDLLVVRKVSSKLQRLSEIVLSNNKPIIIWCQYVDSLLVVSNYLMSLGYNTKTLYGSTTTNNRKKIIKDFRNGNIEILVTNYATLAESISLHQTCHDAIIYEYTFNLVHYTQAKDRIYRVGLKDTDITNYHYSISKQEKEKYLMLEEITLNVIVKKENMMNSFLNEAILMEAKHSILYEIEDQIYDFSKFSQADKKMHQKYRVLSNSVYYPIITQSRMTEIFGTLNIAINYFEKMNNEYSFVDGLFIDSNYNNIVDVLEEYTENNVIDLSHVIDDIKSYQIRNIIPQSKKYRYLDESNLCNIEEVEIVEQIKDSLYNGENIEHYDEFFRKYPKIKSILLK